MLIDSLSTLHVFVFYLYLLMVISYTYGTYLVSYTYVTYLIVHVLLHCSLSLEFPFLQVLKSICPYVFLKNTHVYVLLVFLCFPFLHVFVMHMSKVILVPQSIFHPKRPDYLLIPPHIPL